MPCYDDRSSNDHASQARADKMARIACKVMTALEEIGKEDFLLLRDEEVREWWSEHKEFDRIRREHERLIEEMYHKKK